MWLHNVRVLSHNEIPGNGIVQHIIRPVGWHNWSYSTLQDCINQIMPPCITFNCLGKGPVWTNYLFDPELAHDKILLIPSRKPMI